MLRSERNMRVHFLLATVILVLAFAYDVTKLELMALLSRSPSSSSPR